MKKIIFVIVSLCAFIACQKEQNNNLSEPTTYTVCGKVEKGPFVQGSTISVATLDSKLNATGKTYSTTITDDAGTFGLGAQEFESKYARLTATGYFYNEVTQSLSNGMLTLSALVDLSDKQNINVNLLTHLKAMRIQKLISSDGKSFLEADAQAQTEILKCFGYEKYAEKDVSQFSITAGTDEAAALIIVSSQIQLGRTEAQITEFISKLSTDFAEDGLFSDANKEALQTSRYALFNKLSGIASGIINRYSSLGIYVTVKDLKAFVDWDGDGIPGNEYLKEGEKVVLSKDIIDVPAEGGVYDIDITSPITVFTEKPLSNSPDEPTTSVGIDYYNDSFYSDGTLGGLSVTVKLNGNKLQITVGKSIVRRQDEGKVYLYSFDGTIVATIHIKQAAADKVDVVGLGDAGKAVVSGAISAFAQAMSLTVDGDRYYTLRKNHPQMKAPLDPSYTGIKTIWSNFYQFINYMTRIREADITRRGIYKEFFDIYSAIAYYNMIVFWGGVPYITEPITTIDYYPARQPESTILSSLIENLKASIDYAPDKVNVAVANNADDALLLSKDVARITLANIYMYQGKYSDAKPLLEAVKNTGYYSLDAVETSCPNSQDCIFATHYSSDTKTILIDNQYALIYCYSDVLLSLAECEFKINGGTSGINYVNQILAMCSLPSIQSDVLTGIKNCRAALDLPGYFAFLKRTGIAKSEIGYEDYQLLWPIPAQEVMSNPNMTQNPGY